MNYFVINLFEVGKDDYNYRRWTHLLAISLKIDPSFGIFGRFCPNKKLIKNIGRVVED